MSSPNGTGHRQTILKSLFVGQKLNETLLESVEVVTEVASGARIYDPAAGNHADFIAQAADLVGIVTTEKRGDILIDGQAAEQIPHAALGRQIEPSRRLVE